MNVCNRRGKFDWERILQGADGGLVGGLMGEDRELGVEERVCLGNGYLELQDVAGRGDCSRRDLVCLEPGSDSGERVGSGLDVFSNLRGASECEPEEYMYGHASSGVKC